MAQIEKNNYAETLLVFSYSDSFNFFNSAEGVSVSEITATQALINTIVRW